MTFYFWGILYQSDLKGWALLCYGMYKVEVSDVRAAYGWFLRSQTPVGKNRKIPALQGANRCL